MVNLLRWGQRNNTTRATTRRNRRTRTTPADRRDRRAGGRPCRRGGCRGAGSLVREQRLVRHICASSRAALACAHVSRAVVASAPLRERDGAMRGLLPAYVDVFCLPCAPAAVRRGCGVGRTLVGGLEGGGAYMVGAPGFAVFRGNWGF